MRYILAAAAFLLSGCVTLKTPITEYRMEVSSAQTKSISKGCKEKSLKIMEAFSPNSLMTLSMEYAEPDGKVFAYTQSRWQESPKDAITQQLLKNIRVSEIFGSVDTAKSRSKSNYILETNLEEFLQFYSKDMKSSYADVVINFSLIDTKTNVVIAHKSLSARVEAKSADAKGGVEALNSALTKILQENRVWLDEVCR